MVILRSGSSIKLAGASCCTIGNFDGVHVGHKELLRRVVDAADRLAIPNRIVLTFNPHPLVVLGRLPEIQTLSTFRQKYAIFNDFGITAVRVIRFTKSLASMSAPEFFERFLYRELSCRHLVLGPDTAIGRDREGTIDRLQNIAASYNCTSEVVDCLTSEGLKIGSRLIRRFIAEGDVDGAADLLGYPYTIEGRVMRGDKRGRSLGFPTINLDITKKVQPKYGVYAVRVKVLGVTFKGVANFGIRPTFGGMIPVLETHLLDYSGAEIYGERVEISFLNRIRDEIRFRSVEELRAQIKEDCEIASRF